MDITTVSLYIIYSPAYLDILCHLIFAWPCITDINNMDNQPDATVTVLLIVPISSTCFGQFFPILRSARLCVTACGIMHPSIYYIKINSCFLYIYTVVIWIVHLLFVIKTIKDVAKRRTAYKAGRLLIGWGAISFSKRIVHSSWDYLYKGVGGEIKGRRVIFTDVLYIYYRLTQLNTPTQWYNKIS